MPVAQLTAVASLQLEQLPERRRLPALTHLLLALAGLMDSTQTEALDRVDRRLLIPLHLGQGAMEAAAPAGLSLR
jgi:hypothetical protein